MNRLDWLVIGVVVLLLFGKRFLLLVGFPCWSCFRGWARSDAIDGTLMQDWFSDVEAHRQWACEHTTHFGCRRCGAQWTYSRANGWKRMPVDDGELT